MERKIFDLPEHPTKGKQRIVIERPAPESVWYLVVRNDASIPLVNLENPENPKQVLDALAKQNGEGNVAQFVMDRFSQVDLEVEK